MKIAPEIWPSKFGEDEIKKEENLLKKTDN